MRMTPTISGIALLALATTPFTTAQASPAGGTLPRGSLLDLRV